MPDTANALRRFNRFYTRQIGLLDRSYLDSGMSLTQVRILFEIHEGRRTARDIALNLALDEGYLSRILAGFAKQGLITRHASPLDARRSDLQLTKQGGAQMVALISRSQAAAEARLTGLSDTDKTRLVAATEVIQSCLSDQTTDQTTDQATDQATDQTSQPAVRLRELMIGDIGLIASRHGVLYAKEHGFDQSFELAVADILLDFQRNCRPEVERAWIACKEQQILGSVFCVRVSDQLAKLRLFYLEPEARGLGLGRHMLQSCLEFARAAGYLRMVLWTHETHQAACALYRQAGFTMISANPVQNYGQALVEQEWQIELSQK